MDALDRDRTIRDLVNDASELAARALGYGLARTIEAYVPPRLVGRFAMRVAVALLREVNAREDCAPHVISRRAH